MDLLWSFDLFSHIALSIIRIKRSVILHHWKVMNYFFSINIFLFMWKKKKSWITHSWYAVNLKKSKFSSKRNLQWSASTGMRNWKFLSHIFDILNIYINKLIISLTRDVKLYVLSTHQDNTLSLCLPSSLKLPILYVSE